MTCQQLVLWFCVTSPLIADFKTGEENDYICNGKCDRKVGESKVSWLENFGPLGMDCDTCIST